MWIGIFKLKLFIVYVPGSNGQEQAGVPFSEMIGHEPVLGSIEQMSSYVQVPWGSFAQFITIFSKNTCLVT